MLQIANSLSFLLIDSTIVRKEAEIISSIKSGEFDNMLSSFVDGTIDFLGKLILAIIIFIVGRWIIKKVRRLIDKIMIKRQMDITLRTFLKNVSDILLYAALIVLIINIVGTQTVSIAAIIGSAGLAIGLAVKDNLANFAGGVMLLFHKPFKAGDYVEAQGLAGVVQSIGVLYTMMTTPDNKMVYIPNGPLSTGNIVNYTTQTTRRADITINVEYGTDYNIVNELLLQIANDHPLVLQNPEPFARMVKINQGYIDFTIKVWTKNVDYWTVMFDLTEAIYKRLSEANINIAPPQMAVHLQDK